MKKNYTQLAHTSVEQKLTWKLHASVTFLIFESVSYKGVI